jgi:pimeloyl-ACP methyl ester carboxylesterase
MASEIPNATLEIIPNAGHVWNLEMPERFNDLIREVASAGLSGD